MESTRRAINGTVLLVALVLLPPIVFETLSIPHAGVLAIFITTVGLWITEALPLPVAGLLVPVLAVLYGELPVSEAFHSFGSDILFLFLGCFLMGRSMEKHGFDRRFAYFLLGRCMPGSSIRSITCMLGGVSFFLSMWISNTSATAILSTITLGILVSLEEKIPDPLTRQRVAVRLLLACAFAASIGGLATPVGSPPNLIALQFLNQQGITLSFGEWFVIGFPVALCMLGFMFVIFELFFPVERLELKGIHHHFQQSLLALGPLKAGEMQIATIFVIVILLWVLPGVAMALFPESNFVALFSERCSMSVVGLLGGIATFCLPIPRGEGSRSNLEWSDTDRVEWGTLMLFGGGLTLGMLLEESGLAKELSAALFGGAVSSPVLVGAVAVVISIVLSEFVSNTASAAILIPLVLGSVGGASGAQIATLNLVLAVTFAASFGFMFPVSTPPNAIVYGTGKVPASEMRRVGFVFDVVGGVLIVLIMLVLRGQ